MTRRGPTTVKTLSCPRRLPKLASRVAPNSQSLLAPQKWSQSLAMPCRHLKRRDDRIRRRPLMPALKRAGHFHFFVIHPGWTCRTASTNRETEPVELDGSRFRQD